MQELHLLLDFRRTPGSTEDVEQLRDSLMAAIRAFAESHHFRVVPSDERDTFNSPAENHALTQGWESMNWPLESPDE